MISPFCLRNRPIRSECFSETPGENAEWPSAQIDAAASVGQRPKKWIYPRKPVVKPVKLQDFPWEINWLLRCSYFDLICIYIYIHMYTYWLDQPKLGFRQNCLAVSSIWSSKTGWWCSVTFLGSRSSTTSCEWWYKQVNMVDVWLLRTRSYSTVENEHAWRLSEAGYGMVCPSGTACLHFATADAKDTKILSK